LKKGDWVTYERGFQAVGKVEDVHKDAVYIGEVGYTIVIRYIHSVTVITKEVADILIAVQQQKEK
jgi:hypothetical protein